MDDGYTYDYRKKRQFIYRRFTFKNNELSSKYDDDVYFDFQSIRIFLFCVDLLILQQNLQQKHGLNVLLYLVIQKIQVQ